MPELEEIYGTAEVTTIHERVVVAPAKGRFIPHPPDIFTTEGEWVQEGQIVAEIANGSGSVPVVSAFTGWMMGMLAIAGQPVTTGDALFRIRP
ncbi:MAG TPA: biotin/lipoyl-containing protein [Actinomycetota bacterium]|nr:biotin/lipoyl-containing protein [Actinomycetota bacterium]